MRRLSPAVVAPICFGCLMATAFVTPGFSNNPSGRSSSSVLVLAPESLSPIRSPPGFGRVETVLARIKFNARGNPRLNAKTESALAEAMTALPGTMRSAAFKRVQFLVHKSFPGTADDELALLFRDYYRYRQAELGERNAQARPRDLDAEIDRFERTVALRKHYFGATRAEMLFGRQQALARYLFNIRQLEKTPGLSNEVREAKRRALQTEYEKRIRAVPD